MTGPAGPGAPLRSADAPVAAFRALGCPGAEDMGSRFQYYQEFEAEFCGARPVDGTRALVPGLLSFEA